MLSQWWVKSTLAFSFVAASMPGSLRAQSSFLEPAVSPPYETSLSKNFTMLAANNAFPSSPNMTSTTVGSKSPPTLTTPTTPTSTINSTIPPSTSTSNPPQKPASAPSLSNRTNNPQPTADVPIDSSSYYFHPGIIVLRNGQWQGSDQLLNIGNQIPIYVEIVRPQDDKLEIIQDLLKKKVADIFSPAGITMASVATGNEPPLPIFQIKIFLYPIDRGYAAFCEARLFESVNLKRFQLDPNMAFQAITWQMESLIVAPTDKVVGYINAQVEDFAKTFVERFQLFEQRKNQSSQ